MCGVIDIPVDPAERALRAGRVEDETAASPVDTERLERFADRMVTGLNEAATLLMLSIGHRTGLLDALGRVGPGSSTELAAAAELDERYVREWLHGLTVARIVEREDDGNFRLPAEHAALLTRRNAENLAVFTQYVAQMGAVEDKIVDCFRKGGGVPYSEFTRFHEIMAEDSGQTVLPALHDAILPLVPGLVDRLDEGIMAADLGCGRGLALLSMARRYPNSRFVGWDLSEEAIEYATGLARNESLDNVSFEVRDLSGFDQTAPGEVFDFVTTFDAVHDQADPGSLLKGIRRSLKPGGAYLMQDIHASSDVGGNMDHPVGALLYAVSLSHCMTVSLAQGGEGLGTMWGREKARELLGAAGFESIDVHQLEHDFQNDYWVMQV